MADIKRLIRIPPLPDRDGPTFAYSKWQSALKPFVVLLTYKLCRGPKLLKQSDLKENFAENTGDT